MILVRGSIKIKEKHPDSKIHKRKVKIEDEKEEYFIRRDEILSQYSNCDFETFVKSEKLVNRQLKSEFGKNYRM